MSNYTPIVFTRLVTVTDSSNIDSIKYDPNTSNMAISFLSGATYLYHPVTNALFGSIVSGDSVGVVFADSIRGNKNISFVEYTE
jgi:hypothetical protein